MQRPICFRPDRLDREHKGSGQCFLGSLAIVPSNQTIGDVGYQPSHVTQFLLACIASFFFSCIAVLVRDIVGQQLE